MSAFLDLLLISAVVHFCLLTIFAILNIDISIFNYFEIIGLTLFLPQLTHPVAFFISMVIALGVYVWALNKGKNKQQNV